MNPGHLKTIDTKFILQLVFTMTLFLGSTIVHDLVHAVPHDTSSHMVTQDTTFETKCEKCKPIKKLWVSVIEIPSALNITPLLLSLDTYVSRVPYPVHSFWSRGPPKT